MAGEKTEKATPKRKEEERKKGNIFQSKEVVIVFSLIIMFYSLKLLSPTIMGAIEGSVRSFFGNMATQKELTAIDARQYLIEGLKVFAVTAMPLLLISGLVTVVFTAAQTRLLFSTKSMAFKANRMNPIQGIKKMFSMRAVVEVVKSLVKILVLGYIIYINFVNRLPQMARLIDLSTAQALAFLGDTIMAIVINTAVIFVFVAGFDYFYQWWDYEKNLRMSKQDIKEEYKQTEGDPQIKGKIREKQRQQAMNRMMQDLPTADVVIRNPTHFAVAIKYDAASGKAPMVIAKGADKLAQRIIEIAQEHDIIITENVPLARGLYEAVELGHEIPDKFYKAVAKVLVFVYGLKNKKI